MSTLRERICPRCGKTRSLKRYPQGRKTPMCQPCAASLVYKRHHAAGCFWIENETIEDKLTWLSQ